LRALGVEPPRYLHVPLVLGPDGERLGKRHGSLALAELKERRVPAERVVTLLGRSLGLLDAEHRELDARSLVERFELTRLSRAPVRLADADLRW